jgi:hypothetical protein
VNIFTVTYGARPLAVVRAATAPAAVVRTRELLEPCGFAAPGASDRPGFAVRRPTDGELLAWLDRRGDTLLPGVFAAVL